GSRPEVYRVAWQLAGPGTALPTEASLIVLWFPPNAQTAKGSDLLTSRTLAQCGERCVAAVLVTPDNAKAVADFKINSGQQSVVLITPDGKEVGRVEAKPGGKLDLTSVERLVEKEISAREKATSTMLKAAEAKAKAGDKSAVDDLQKVWAQRCLFPSFGKRAAKALQKLGVKVAQEDLQHLGPDGLPDSDITNQNVAVETLLRQGLEAELASNYRVAEGFYREASEIDPADATPLRFLGELYRHQTGEWDKAGQMFNRILSQPADPIARAVALHGLGKMTIHAGRYAAGLKLFEQSLASFPLAITYRNLAVYWFSEKQEEKAAGYMRKALALEPDDTYNQIFAAVYLAAAGHKDEAIKIARANENVLEASYNLAALWAQVGDRTKAMELLKRHFYAYERYDAVRAMEMKEARDDYMFAELHSDAEFIELTKLAKAAYLVGSEFCSPATPAGLIIEYQPMPGSAPKGD
ncbi:MAG TPA: tetratricopeptide repeat protein, partial [Candidatus Didemnitutus sp.]|nr:tetratricopeptide repeat protein [Candidatus Didemnitutus sp.]